MRAPDAMQRCLNLLFFKQVLICFIKLPGRRVEARLEKKSLGSGYTYLSSTLELCNLVKILSSVFVPGLSLTDTF